MKQDSRLSARTTEDIKDKIELAAKMSGQTLSQFIISSSLRAAWKVFERERVWSMTQEQSKRFFEALDNPREPNDKMKKQLKQTEITGDL